MDEADNVTIKAFVKDAVNERSITLNQEGSSQTKSMS